MLALAPHFMYYYLWTTTLTNYYRLTPLTITITLDYPNYLFSFDYPPHQALIAILYVATWLFDYCIWYRPNNAEVDYELADFCARGSEFAGFLSTAILVMMFLFALRRSVYYFIILFTALDTYYVLFVCTFVLYESRSQ